MITVIYCTREPNPTHTSEIIKSSGLGKKIEVIEIVNNGESLTKAYNRGLSQATNDIVVFLHDDIEFDTKGWGNKIIKHFEENPEFGILGLAGTTDLPATGRWWDDRSKMVGIVNHKHEGKKWESKYSKSWENEITEVVTVDGLFFAIHKKRIKNVFDENVVGFHFYEIDFVFSNHLNGVRVGVMYNIRVTHKSIGMTNQQWDDNRVQFIEKYKDKLPYQFVPDFYIPKKSLNLNLKPKIKVVIQSSGDITNFETLYKNILSFNYPTLKIALISNEDNYDELKDLSFNQVTIFEGYYNSLPKNLSILKFEENFIEKDDELVFFMNDNAEIISNIFANFAKIYSSNKNAFGGGFPLSYNQDKTIFCSKLEIMTNKDMKVAINMKDGGSYYNICNGFTTSGIGNLSDCFVTTANNLKSLDWFKLNYTTPLFFNDFALRLHLRNKLVYNDTNSMIVQKSFSGQTNIQEDFQSLINFIGTDKKLQALVKQIA